MCSPFSCFPTPPAFPPVDTNWKALHRPAKKGLVLVVGIQAGWLWFALEKHSEKWIWVFHEANRLHPWSEIQWEWEAKHRGAQQKWWSLQRQGEGFGLVLFSEWVHMVLLGVSCCLAGGGVFFPAVAYVHTAVANGKFGEKWTWMMWSSKAVFLRCWPKLCLRESILIVFRCYVSCLRNVVTNFHSRIQGRALPVDSFGTSAVLII